MMTKFSFLLAKVTSVPVPLAIPSLWCVSTVPKPTSRSGFALASSVTNTLLASTSALMAWFHPNAPLVFDVN